jgi:protein TonB
VAGNVIQEAVPLLHYNHPPPYPRAARRRGFEGLVEVNVLVDINGRVKEQHLHVSSGHTVLDKAALKAIRRWRFTPGRQNGKIMEMWVKVPVRFKLIAD